MPGESYLGLLDALYGRRDVDTVVCRHESGAGFMVLIDVRLSGREAASPQPSGALRKLPRQAQTLSTLMGALRQSGTSVGSDCRDRHRELCFGPQQNPNLKPQESSSKTSRFLRKVKAGKPKNPQKYPKLPDA